MNADLAFAVGISLDIVTKRASAAPITAYPSPQGDGRSGLFWRGPANLRQDRNDISPSDISPSDISPSYAAAHPDQPLSQLQRHHRGERERNDNEETPTFH
jgi:hypothetical protein